MGRRLYVGNLPYRTTEEELSNLFSHAGAVETVEVMRDSMTGRARGFGFVEMATEEGAQKAITEFHQYQLDGRALVVNEARPKTPGGGRSYAGTGSGAGYARPAGDLGGESPGGGEYLGGRRREPRW
jgi:RNA recognition motif-containing protein